MKAHHETAPHILQLNLIVVGDPGVGKSALVERFITGECIADRHPKFIASSPIISKTAEINGKEIKLNIQVFDYYKEAMSIAKTQFRQANGMMIVYDATNAGSYENAVKMADSYSKDHQVILVAAKSDQHILVDSNKVKKDAEKKGWMFCETSATKNLNVERAFVTLASAITQQKQQTQLVDDANRHYEAIYKMLDACTMVLKLAEIGKSSALRKEYLHLLRMIKSFVEVKGNTNHADSFEYIETVKKYAEWLSQQEERKPANQSKSGKFASKHEPDARIQRVCRVIASITDEKITRKDFKDSMKNALTNAPTKKPSPLSKP